MRLRLATRTSPLARHQAETVAARLREAGAADDVELVPVSTEGDRRTEVPIGAFSGHGVFTTDVERAVLEGRADVAVHSAKDLPSANPPAGLVLAAVPERADVRDALIGRPLAALEPGAPVATGAPRRRAQLAAVRPDLRFVELRGNIATRLERVPENGSAVVALAALERLGLAGEVAEILGVEVMLPQVGQGALALRCREDDEATRRALSRIDDAAAAAAVACERAFLARLGGGCDAPVGAYATLGDDGTIALEAMVAALDGSVVLRRKGVGQDPRRLGEELGDLLLAASGPTGAP